MYMYVLCIMYSTCILTTHTTDTSMCCVSLIIINYTHVHVSNISIVYGHKYNYNDINFGECEYIIHYMQYTSGLPRS